MLISGDTQTNGREKHKAIRGLAGHLLHTRPAAQSSRSLSSHTEASLVGVSLALTFGFLESSKEVEALKPIFCHALGFSVYLGGT